MPRHLRFALIALPAVLAGCATAEQAKAPLTTAVVTPLSDLNLVRDDMPEVLKAARDKPYRVQPAPDCPALHAELASLDEVLGPDLDVPEEDKDLSAKLGQAATKAVVKAVGRTAEGVIPMRGWVRKLSGAEKRQDEIHQATQAGMVRRAFIKGWMAAGNCKPELPGASPVLTDAKLMN